MRLVPSVLVLLLVASCGVNEKRYNKKVSKAFCKWEERCESADFYDNFDSVKACSDAQEQQLAKLDEYYTAKCTFDNKKAKACIKALKSSCKDSAAEFETLFQPCYEVWDCAQDFNASTDSSPLF